jgi:hypothetical protein
VLPSLSRNAECYATGRVAEAAELMESAMNEFHRGLSRLITALRSLIYGRGLTD